MERKDFYMYGVTAEKGRDFLADGKILRKKCFPCENGDREITAKAVDSFCFVEKMKLTLAPGGAITAFTCSCGGAFPGKGFCVHGVALLTEIGHWTVEEPLPESAQGPEEPAEPEEDVPSFAPEVYPEAEPEEWPEEEPEEEPKEEPEEEPEDEPEEEPEAVSAPVEAQAMEILFGTEPETGREILWRPNDTGAVFHTNTGIIGTMGTGKTQFTKSLVAQFFRERGKNYGGTEPGILIFDYKGDYNETKKDFVTAVGAKVLKPYRLPFNPMALFPTPAFKPLLPVHTGDIFKDTISRNFHLGAKQQQLLMDCILMAYEGRGIRPDDPATWRRPAPTFEQVYAAYQQVTEGKVVDSLSAAMNKLHQFCIFETDPRRARPLSELLCGVTVIDLSGYGEDIQNLVVAITLDQLYAQMEARGSSATDGRFRELRTLVLVDEADNFLSQDFPALRKIMKEGREFGVGVVLSTQSLSHFVGGEDDYSRYILTWVVHNVGDLKQREVEYVFKYPPKSEETEETYAAIKHLGKHESIIKIANDKPVAVRDLAFWQLLENP